MGLDAKTQIQIRSDPGARLFFLADLEQIPGPGPAPPRGANGAIHFPTGTLVIALTPRSAQVLPLLVLLFLPPAAFAAAAFAAAAVAALPSWWPCCLLLWLLLWFLFKGLWC